MVPILDNRPALLFVIGFIITGARLSCESSPPQQSIDPPLPPVSDQVTDTLSGKTVQELPTPTRPDTKTITPLPLPPTATDQPRDPTIVPPNLPVPNTAPMPPPASRSASGLIIPVSGIRSEDLIDTYTQARSGGRVHNAIDIIAPQGTPVLAAADGTIKRFFTSDKGGLTIYQIAPDNQTVYYYAHLDRYADGLRKGVTVRQGQVIGYVGDTGNAVPGNYHLHFAIWVTDDPSNYWDGESINPYPLLKDADAVE